LGKGKEAEERIENLFREELREQEGRPVGNAERDLIGEGSGRA